MKAIQTENLCKSYGAVKALDGLTLSVEQGTVFGFLGPNGAGKSTTIRLLTGLARPTSGSGQVAGVEISNSLKLATHIGYLPEEPGFYSWMTPVEFLEYIGRLFGLKPQDYRARAYELLELVGLAESRKRRIGGFSRGMRQRLGLAQALVSQPQVLLLDEPVSALDPAGRKEVLELITQLRSRCTIFMSTHILADVERVCDSVGILNHGKLVVEARQDELLARYTIPAFELECEPGNESDFKTWAEGLTLREWVNSVDIHGTIARIAVKDLEAGRQALLPAAFQSRIPLRRYEIVTPSLEDIFLRLVGQEQVQ